MQKLIGKYNSKKEFIFYIEYMDRFNYAQKSIKEEP